MSLPHDSTFGILSKIINRTTAKLFKIILDKTVPKYYEKTQNELIHPINIEPRERKIVVSLTSFEARLDDVWIVIESIFRQTYKADKVVLWLGNHLKNKQLPFALLCQKQKGLEIRYVDDLRAHTKYFYALQEFNDCHVITVDDDCYYPNDIIENLIRLNHLYPDSIVANRIHGIVHNKEGKIAQYHNWKHNYIPNSKDKLPHLLTGVSGVLYPPNVYDKTLFEKEVFMEICKFADDIWLTANAIKQNIQIKTNPKFNKDFISISKTSRVRLLDHNSKSGGNDQQLMSVFEYLKLKI